MHISKSICRTGKIFLKPASQFATRKLRKKIQWRLATHPWCERTFSMQSSYHNIDGEQTNRYFFKAILIASNSRLPTDINVRYDGSFTTPRYTWIQLEIQDAIGEHDHSKLKFRCGICEKVFNIGKGSTNIKYLFISKHPTIDISTQYDKANDSRPRNDKKWSTGA